MFQRLIAIFIAVLVAASPAVAQDNCAQAEEFDVDALLSDIDDSLTNIPYPRGLYWKVSRDGADSLIYGTVHVPDPRLDIPTSLFDAIETADGLVLEIDDLQAVDMQSVILSRLDIFFQIDGPNMRPLFSADEWQMILRRLEPTGLPEILANRMKPWILGALMFFDQCESLLNARAGDGVDAMMQRHAKAFDVPVVGLETIDDLLNLIDDRDEARDLAALKQILQFPIPKENSPDALLPLYLRGETMAVWSLFENRMYAFLPRELAKSIVDGTYELLLTKRNIAWVEQLNRLLDNGNIVVGVGALHLPGETGILRLLEERGFTVTPVKG